MVSPFGWRMQGQACVTIVSGNENDAIVVIGGQMLRGSFFHSPIWLGTLVFLGVLIALWCAYQFMVWNWVLVLLYFSLM